MLRTFAEMFFG